MTPDAQNKMVTTKEAEQYAASLREVADCYADRCAVALLDEIESLRREADSTQIVLNGTESVLTFGGESYIDGLDFAEYGISMDDYRVHNLTPDQAVTLACALVNHLIRNGHRFEIQDTGEQDQRQRLVWK